MYNIIIFSRLQRKRVTEVAKLRPGNKVMANRRWLAIYTKPRWEKKLDLEFRDQGIESYCPVNKVRRKWSDRIKLVEEPLFKSYVFVHVNGEEEKTVRLVNGMLNFVYWLGKPAVIKQTEIDRIKRFLNEYEDVTTELLSIKQDDKVMVTSGALMEKEGKVLRRLGNRVELEIISLGYRLVAYVERKNVKLLNKR